LITPESNNPIKQLKTNKNLKEKRCILIIITQKDNESLIDFLQDLNQQYPNKTSNGRMGKLPGFPVKGACRSRQVYLLSSNLVSQ